MVKNDRMKGAAIPKTFRDEATRACVWDRLVGVTALTQLAAAAFVALQPVRA